MQYLDEVAVEIGTDKIDARPLADLIQSNLVVKNLKTAGYEIINFPSEYEYTENIQADQSYSAQPYISSLDQLLITNSGLYPFIHQKLYQWHRDEVLYPLSELSKLPDSPSPRFVMVHIYSPHPPFVFDAHGNPILPPYRYTGA